MRGESLIKCADNLWNFLVSLDIMMVGCDTPNSIIDQENLIFQVCNAMWKIKG